MKQQIKAILYTPTEQIVDVEFPIYRRVERIRYVRVKRVDADYTEYSVEKYVDPEDGFRSFELAIDRNDGLRIVSSSEDNDELDECLGIGKYASSKAEFDEAIDDMITELRRVKG